MNIVCARCGEPIEPGPTVLLGFRRPVYVHVDQKDHGHYARPVTCTALTAGGPSAMVVGCVLPAGHTGMHRGNRGEGWRP